MKKTFGSHLSDLYVTLPTIVAELNEDMHFFNRGSRAYLMLRNEDPLSYETVECFMRTSINHLRVVEVPWRMLRFVCIERVPSVIGERCWRGTKAEMEALVERIKNEKTPRVNNFEPNVDFG